MFVPAKASTKGLKRNDAKPYFIGAGILVAFLLILVLADSGSGDKGAGDNANRVTEPRVETGSANPRVAAAKEWLRGLQDADVLRLGRYTDITAMRKHLGIENADGTAAEVESRVVKALLESESTEFLRHSMVFSGSVTENEANAPAGKVTVRLSVAREHAAQYVRGDDAIGEVLVDFRMNGTQPLVTGFTVTTTPPKRAPVTDRERASVHPVLGQAHDVQRVYNGQTETVREAEIKPLDHLEDTPAEVRTEIDALVAKLIDLDAPGAQAFRVTQRMRDIGPRPVIPRLLNQMYEIHADSRENILRLRRITQALEDLTGQRFGFNPAMTGDSNNTAAAELRESALKQWYGWWADNHWRKDPAYAIDHGEDLLGPEDAQPQPRSRPQAPGGAQPPAQPRRDGN
ncbi:MAG: hypothetical protein IPM29_18915 [Planctomycetes bacterium]|nr:hypothetical protein [Planctomycetota bacterium]